MHIKHQEDSFLDKLAKALAGIVDEAKMFFLFFLNFFYKLLIKLLRVSNLVRNFSYTY